MSDHLNDDLGMDSEDLSLSNPMLDSTKPNDNEVDDYTLKRETDSYIEPKESPDGTKPNDNEVDDYTLKRETDSYIEPKESPDGSLDNSSNQKVESSGEKRRQVRRNRDSSRMEISRKAKEVRDLMMMRMDNFRSRNDPFTKPSDYTESRESYENSEEERVIRLPSETEMTDVPVTHERSHSESMSNFFSMPAYRRNDCLNFSQQSRELAYMKHTDVFENWKYSDEERAFLRHRVETFSKEQCVIHCILGHMLMGPEEMDGIRHAMPMPDEARQALLSLAIGSHWDVFNLAILMAFSEKLNVDGSINKNFQGAPIYSAAYHHGDEFRSRVELYFARLLDD